LRTQHDRLRRTKATIGVVAGFAYGFAVLFAAMFVAMVLVAAVSR
jgi:hypothetical protein